MNDLILISMYLSTIVLMFACPYVGWYLWKKDVKERAAVEAFNKWYREERLKQIKEHKITLLELKRKRMELEMKWELDYKARSEELAAQVEKDAMKASSKLSASEVLARTQR